MAKLPLLLSDYNFEFLNDNGNGNDSDNDNDNGNDSDTNDHETGDDDTTTNQNLNQNNPNQSQNNKQRSKSKQQLQNAQNAPHFNIRDDEGRLFACRVYKESQLTKESVESSMFDLAIEKEEDDNDDDGHAKMSKEDLSEEDGNEKNGKEAKNKAKESKKKHKIGHKVVEERDVALMDVMEERILPHLLHFGCRHIQIGWWAYEWCDDQYIKQKHEDKDSRVEISLGTFVQRLIYITVQGADDYDATIKYHFQNGDFCEESGKHRKVELELSCCDKFVSQKKKYPKWNEKIAKRVDFMSIQEHEMCSYMAHACTPMLCLDNLLKERKSIAENRTAVGEEDSPSISIEDSSVREVLAHTVGKTCVSKNEGW